MAKSFGKVFILGDSYSTFEGCIPAGNCNYYVTKYTREFTEKEIGAYESDCLSGMDKTWWHKLFTQTGSTLVLNDSWAGSTVCKTGFDGKICEDSAFVNRIKKYFCDGKVSGEKIDTIFFFGGTNDCWAGSPMGEVKYEGITAEDTLKTLPAYAEILRYIKEQSADVRIICVVNCDLKDELYAGVKEICKHYGVELVLLRDITKKYGHPDENGMEAIKQQIMDECC